VLGLPLLQLNVDQSGGSLQLYTHEGLGTTVTATFRLSHIDRPPTGDVAGVFLLSAIGQPHIELSYAHITGNGCFRLTTTQLKEVLGELPLGSADVRKGVRELITNNLESIQASK